MRNGTERGMEAMLVVKNNRTCIRSTDNVLKKRLCSIGVRGARNGVKCRIDLRMKISERVTVCEIIVKGQTALLPNKRFTSQL